MVVLYTLIAFSEYSLAFDKKEKLLQSRRQIIILKFILLVYEVFLYYSTYIHK